jgi:integrase
MSRKKVDPYVISRKLVKVGSYRYWRIYGTSATGKKHSFYANTEEEAKGIRDEKNAEHRLHGQNAQQLSERQRVDAMHAIEALDNRCTLLAAAQLWLRHNPVTGTRTFEEAMNLYLESKSREGLRPKYEKDLRTTLTKVSRDFPRNVSDITTDELETWLDGGFSPVTRNAYIRDLSQFFDFCARKRWLADNPVKGKIKRGRVHLKMPEIYDAEAALKLLKAAVAKPDSETLPVFALGLFSGIRVEEMGRVHWGMVNWRENVIRLDGPRTKTYTPRPVPITAVLRHWLSMQKKESGPVFPRNWRGRSIAIHEAAGVKKVQNGLRHSFASHHASLHKNATALQLILGQQTESVLFRHYVQGVTRAEAKAYFGLRSKPDDPENGSQS